MNTDKAEPKMVLAEVGICAATWVPDARIIGNVRAGDIVRAVNAILNDDADERAWLYLQEAHEAWTKGDGLNDAMRNIGDLLGIEG